MTNSESANRQPSAAGEVGLSRRKLLHAGAGLGAAGVAAGLMAGTGAGFASAASARPAATATPEGGLPNVGEPMVAHVHDARTGEVDLFVGEKHVRFTDPAFVARLTRAAR